MARAPDEEAFRERAAARRRLWPVGEVVTTGTPKGALCEAQSAVERVVHLATLSMRVSRLSGVRVPTTPRAELPCEVFVIAHGPDASPD